MGSNCFRPTTFEVRDSATRTTPLYGFCRSFPAVSGVPISRGIRLLTAIAAISQALTKVASISISRGGYPEMTNSLATAMSAPASAAMAAAASTMATLPEISPTVGSNCNNAMTVTNHPHAAPHSTLRRWPEGLSRPPCAHGRSSLDARLARWLW